jgi:hypothetical protein
MHSYNCTWFYKVNIVHGAFRVHMIHHAEDAGLPCCSFLEIPLSLTKKWQLNEQI